VPARLVTDLSAVDIGRGTEALYGSASRPAEPTGGSGRVASITASSAIEGIVVNDTVRASRILAGTAKSLRTRSEQELAGYRDAQDYLFQDAWKPLNVGLLLHLHDSSSDTHRPRGEVQIRRQPRRRSISVWRHHRPLQTRFGQRDAVLRNGAYRSVPGRDHDNHHHPVLLIGLFVLDLLVIHPFEDGNGRVARALTNALLIDAGYTVSRYVSLEHAIASRPTSTTTRSCSQRTAGTTARPTRGPG